LHEYRGMSRGPILRKELLVDETTAATIKVAAPGRSQWCGTERTPRRAAIVTRSASESAFILCMT